MLKYIHCNKCFRNEPVSETRYLLTHCGHVLCGSCLDHASDAYSSSNKTKGGTQRSLLQNDPAALNKAERLEADDLPPRIQPFFRTFETICYDTMDIWKFHEDNLSGLIDHLQSKTNRQHQILVRARAELLNMKKIKCEMQELKKENERLKRKIQEWESTKNNDRQEHHFQKSHEKTSGAKHGQTIASKLSSGKNVDRPEETSTVTKKLRSHTDNHPSERGDKATRERPSMSNNSSIWSGRTALVPRTPQPPGRLSLVSSSQAASPRIILHPQLREGFTSPTSSSLRRGMPPTPIPVVQSSCIPQIVAPSSSGIPPIYVQNPGQGYMVGPPGSTIHQTSIPGLAPTGTCSRIPVYPMAPPPTPLRPRFPVAENSRRTGVQAGLQPTVTLNSRAMASVGQPPGSLRLVQSSGNELQGHLIRTRNSASTARTTWHQQQQQQQLYPMAPPTFPGPNTLVNAAIPPTILPSILSRPH
ncbi:MAG: hypothetical protein J3Q66DRAFT_404068 [Benniella sp.]|nr:MAG: hypothetical protein J3Q66DRAFT_404068 [Benniella sp.]